MKNTNLILVAVLTLVVGIGVGFFGGMKYQENQRPTTMRFNQMPGNRNNFRPINGEIISTGENTITVKLTDGSSKIVMLSQSTAINKAATASATDLKAGTPVAVFGQTNTDGSVTAQNVQLNPQPLKTQ